VEPAVRKGQDPVEVETPPPRNKKEAVKPTRAIIVAAPKEEAEMVDMGARPKRRGRPRKNPIVDPPDPHKGSVLCSENGVCADPVDKGAILGEGGGGTP
jgi:hypothetical protein